MKPSKSRTERNAKTGLYGYGPDFGWVGAVEPRLERS